MVIHVGFTGHYLVDWRTLMFKMLNVLCPSGCLISALYWRLEESKMGQTEIPSLNTGSRFYRFNIFVVFMFLSKLYDNVIWFKSARGADQIVSLLIELQTVQQLEPILLERCLNCAQGGADAIENISLQDLLANKKYHISTLSTNWVQMLFKPKLQFLKVSGVCSSRK